MTKQIFCLLIHLSNQINQFPQVSNHSTSPTYSLVPLSVHTISPRLFPHTCFTQKNGRTSWYVVQDSIHTFHPQHTDYRQTSQLSICHYSNTIVPTSVTLLIAMMLLTLFGSIHVWKVFFLMSCQHGSVVLKASVLNSKLTHTKVHSHVIHLNDVSSVRT